MQTYKAKQLIGWALVVLLLSAGHGYAQGVGNVGALPSVFPIDVGGGGWTIGVYPVIRDPNGPAWIKTLTGPNGLPTVAQPGQSFHLIETLIIGPDLGWTDWHEQILSPGWDWVLPNPLPPMLYGNGSPAPGLVTVHTPGNSATGGTIDFYFDELPPGTTVTIRKVLQYNDPTGTPFEGKVVIAEYPTPEPATLGLVGLSGLLLFVRKRSAVV